MPRYAKIPKYQDTKIPRYQDTRIPRHQDTEIPRYQDTKIGTRYRRTCQDTKIPNRHVVTYVYCAMLSYDRYCMYASVSQPLWARLAASRYNRLVLKVYSANIQRYNRSRYIVARLDIFPLGFLVISGNVSERSQLKLMLHITVCDY